MLIWSTEIKELEILHSSIKDHSTELDKELEQLIKTEDANVVMLYSRRCLEVIITDLCKCELKRPRKTEPLKGIIDKLNQEEKVPSHIIASMHSLNSLSTFGAHPKEYEQEQVKPVLLNLTTVIKWYLKYKIEKGEAEERYKGQGAGDKVQGAGDKVQGAGVKGSMGQGIKGSRGQGEIVQGIGEKVQGTGEELQGTSYKVQVVGNRAKGVDGQDNRANEMDGKHKDHKETDHISNTWKKPTFIISGILIVAFVLYIVLDQFHIFRKDKFQDIRDPEGKISIAVMPFENQTGDTTLNWFQRGISSLIINGLGNSSELAVLDDQTMFEAIESMNQVYTAGISPSVAKEVAKKVKAETYLSGSFQGREGMYWILVNLVNTENGNIIWTNKVEGNLKSSGYLDLADSLCYEIKNYLEIKALEDIADYEFREVYPKSAEAFRYFIEGMNLVLNQDYESGIQSLKKALEIDSSFTFASFYLAYAYCYSNQTEQAKLWTKKTYASKDRVPPKYRPWLELWNACYFDGTMQNISRYCDLLAESGINTRLLWSDLGITYIDFLHQYEKAIKAFEKVMEINLEKGSDWKFDLFYARYGMALHKVGNHAKEKEIYDIGLSFFPNSIEISYRQIICALSLGDTINANKYIAKGITIRKEAGYSESYLARVFGNIYEEANIPDKAEVYYRQAYELKPQSTIDRIFFLARFLIKYNINIDEGMELVQKGLEIDPDQPDLLAVKGLGYYKQGKYEEALEIYRRADKIDEGFNYEINQYIIEAEQAIANKNKTQ
jgi:tetratricopeptide (TPR) repeat protein